MIGSTAALMLTAKIGNSRLISAMFSTEKPPGRSVDQEHAMPSEPGWSRIESASKPLTAPYQSVKPRSASSSSTGKSTTACDPCRMRRMRGRCSMIMWRSGESVQAERRRQVWSNCV